MFRAVFFNWGAVSPELEFHSINSLGTTQDLELSVNLPNGHRQQ